jgi:hypothetical protein
MYVTQARMPVYLLLQHLNGWQSEKPWLSRCNFRINAKDLCKIIVVSAAEITAEGIVVAKASGKSYYEKLVAEIGTIDLLYVPSVMGKQIRKFRNHWHFLPPPWKAPCHIQTPGPVVAGKLSAEMIYC